MATERTDGGFDVTPPVSAKQHCVDLLRRMLHSGELNPGDRLPLQGLAARFGVSTTPVREAAWQLSAEGLLSVLPRVGIFVRSITVQEILDIYEIKTAMEPLLAAWAAERSTPEERSQFVHGFHALEAAAKQGNLEKYVALVERRRAVLMEMARSPALADEFAVIDGRVRLLRYQNLSQLGTLAASSSQHKRIADAVGRGDPGDAHSRMAEHMRDAGARVRRLLDVRAAEPLLSAIEVRSQRFPHTGSALAVTTFSPDAQMLKVPSPTPASSV